MKLTIYQVDAFADRLFKGNPAAVIPLESWIDESLMQQIAMENNLAETAFFLPSGESSSKKNPDGSHFDIRWFTPTLEIDLCGHATLASAWVLFNQMKFDKPTITFHSKSGPLIVSRNGEIISMDFPSWKPERVTDYPADLEKILGVTEIVGVYKHRDLVIELNSEDEVRNAKPDFGLMKKSGYKMIITAAGKQSRDKTSANIDFVSRFFAPTIGIDEDPVTGSSHSQIIPFWSEKLGKSKMEAKQLSSRGGYLQVEQKGDRVIMGGHCVFYMKGEIYVS